jgi:uncharacterized protein (TIGR02145 family)
MNIFKQLYRTLVLAAVMVVGAVCVSNGQTRPAELVGQWVYFGGSKEGPDEKIELFKDGTGVSDGETVKWKVENKRLVFLSAFEGLACNYKVAGYELTLTYDDGKSATFVKKEKLEEYKKKKEEEEKKEVERLIKETKQKRKEAEQKFEKISSYFTDSRNGQKYRTVKIRGKTWMAENLNYQTGKSWCYDDDNSNCEIYGRLYDWNTAKMACPTGWHLPLGGEWNELELAAADVYVAGKALKSTYGWYIDGNGTDEFGFSALPGGSRRTDGSFYHVGELGYWWVATEHSGLIARGRRLYYGKDVVLDDLAGKGDGNSVRCRED